MQCCETDILSDAKFCHRCGKRVNCNMDEEYSKILDKEFILDDKNQTELTINNIRGVGTLNGKCKLKDILYLLINYCLNNTNRDKDPNIGKGIINVDIQAICSNNQLIKDYRTLALFDRSIEELANTILYFNPNTHNCIHTKSDILKDFAIENKCIAVDDIFELEFKYKHITFRYPKNNIIGAINYFRSTRQGAVSLSSKFKKGVDVITIMLLLNGFME